MTLKKLTNQKVMIMGFGWLGLPLAIKLRQLGMEPIGTTTHPDKKKRIEESYQLPTLLFELPLKGFEEVKAKWNEIDTLIINFPPQGSKNLNEGSLHQFLEILTLEFPSDKRLIFISSTSVFGPEQGLVNEESKPNPQTIGGIELYQAEEMLLNYHKNLTIIRPGGLIGGERHPIKFLAGRNDVPGGLAKVHLVFREDLIDLIINLISHPEHLKHPPKIVHAFSQLKLNKADYYESMAVKFELKPPRFTNEKLENDTKIESLYFEHFLERAPKSPLFFEYETEDSILK